MTEDLSNNNFLVRKKFFFLRSTTFLQIAFEKYANFHLERAIDLIYLLNLATLPQGVTSGELVFVLPPWGWSTGFIATPRTLGRDPKFLE